MTENREPDQPDSGPVAAEQESDEAQEITDLPVPADQADDVAGGATTLVGYGTFSVGHKR